MRIALIGLPVLLAPVLLTLGACNANRGPTTSSAPGARVALSSAQSETVKASVRRFMEGGGADARFGSMGAAKVENGTMVCGFVKGGKAIPDFPAGSPYMGMLYQGSGFTTDEVARDGGTAYAVVSACRDRGIAL